MSNNQESKLNTGLAIIGITLIEIVALYKGMDGMVLTLVIGGLCGLGGYHIHKFRIK
mgnify:CR=1 FL=1